MTKPFDLQLFAEEQPQNEQQEQQQEQTTQQEDSASEQQQIPEFGITETGEVIINDPQEEQQQEESQQEEQPQYYTPDELKNADFSSIDPNKLPPELQAIYRSMQAPFTKAMQQIAEAKKTLEQQQQPPTQNNSTTQQEQADPYKQQRQYYEQVYTVAKTNVEKALGEPLDEFNPLHISALADEVANIKAYVVQTQTQQRQLQNVIAPYEADPEWESIRDYSKQVLESLPWQQSLAIRQKLDSGDLHFIGQFLETAKTEYYKSKNPQAQQQQQANKPKPPVVENSGSGNSQPITKTFDPKSLGRMSNDELAKAFVDLGLVDM